jgi:hypothetical protein
MKDRPTHLNSVAGQMIFWLLIQFAFLGVGVFQIPMWDLDPKNGGLEWMVGGQIAVMSLIFGVWMDRWDKVGIWIATCWPMGILAALMTGKEMSSAVKGEIYVSIWFMVLGLWRWIGKNQGLLLSVVIGLVTLGGGVMAYLRAEFTPQFEIGWGDTKNFGPLTEGLWIVDKCQLRGGLLLMYTVVITGLIALILFYKERKKR